MKLDIPEDDEISLNDPAHPFILQVVEHGLDWSDLLYPDETEQGNFNVVLMIGRKIGDFGWEGIYALDFGEDELTNLAAEVKARLKEADIPGTPRLWMVFQPDDF